MITKDLICRMFGISLIALGIILAGISITVSGMKTIQEGTQTLSVPTSKTLFQWSALHELTYHSSLYNTLGLAITIIVILAISISGFILIFLGKDYAIMWRGDG